MKDLYVRHGDSEEVFVDKNEMCLDIFFEGVPLLYRKAVHPWQEYFRKTAFAKRKDVRMQYYKSGQWILTRNWLLWERNFVCAGCGGIANQAHHQGWSNKWKNYEHLGDTDKEDKCLVPICEGCHDRVTRVHNPKLWHTKHVESRIKIQSQSPFLQSGLYL